MRQSTPKVPNPAEEWRPVVGFEGAYAVSNLGRVRSIRRGGMSRTRGIVLKAPVRNGYPRVTLRRGSYIQVVNVHILVARAFLGPRPDGAEIRHLDGDRLNCAVDNLSYGTRSENMFDAVGHGTHHQTAKTHCPKGHPYDEVNTYVLPSRPTARYCRACRRRRRREHWARQKEAQ